MNHFFISILLLTSSLQGTNWYDPLSWLPTTWVTRTEEQISKEYPITDETSFSLSFETGTATVQTWQQARCILHIRKKARFDDALPRIKVTHKKEQKKISYSITQPDEQTTVELLLIIPEQLNLELNITDQGTCHISSTPRHITGRINQGSITIRSQNICTMDLSLEKGPINIECAQFTSQSSLLARTAQGAINLTMPLSFGATVHAFTQQGTITIEYPFTLEAIKLPLLNKKQLTALTRTIHGFIGENEHETAAITVRASNDITIAPQKASAE